MEYKYNGIILGKNDIAETDRIYSIYTREAGKIRVLGKGVEIQRQTGRQSRAGNDGGNQYFPNQGIGKNHQRRGRR